MVTGLNKSAMRKIIVIPARYASTRLPAKPLIEINGKPIIQWVYEKASGSRLKDRIIVATDDERILKVALAFGAEAVMTSPACKSGTDRVYEAMEGQEGDIVINLQGDEPFIRADMVDTLFLAIERDNLNMATLCCPLKDDSELTDPNTVKVVIDKDSFALYFSRSPIPFVRGQRRAPLYKHVGIYGFGRSFLEQFVFLEKSRLEETESLEQLRVLENGYKIKVLTTQYDGFGIDTEADLERARIALSAMS
jgi:3-deoxy-manno-octulosonate cytidylyltransferase (CMP-KDO synthetase)